MTRARSRTRTKHFGAALLCSVFWSYCFVAAAQISDLSRENAQELGARGIELFEKGEYRSASDSLERAYSIIQVTTLGLWSARALDKVGHLLGARERYRATLHLPAGPAEPPIFQAARADAERELDVLKSRIPSLTIRVEALEPTRVSVTLDGEPLALELLGIPIGVNPGSHRVVATLNGGTLQEELVLPESAERAVVLRFDSLAIPAVAPPAPQTDPWFESRGALSADQKSWAYVALGIGGAGLISGTIFQVVAVGKQSELESSCPGNQCEPKFHDDVDSLNRTKTLAFASYLLAAAGAGTGAVLYLTSPDETLPSETAARAKSKVQPRLAAEMSAYAGVRSVGVAGSF